MGGPERPPVGSRRRRPVDIGAVDRGVVFGRVVEVAPGGHRHLAVGVDRAPHVDRCVWQTLRPEMAFVTCDDLAGAVETNARVAADAFVQALGLNRRSVDEQRHLVAGDAHEEIRALVRARLHGAIRRGAHERAVDRGVERHEPHRAEHRGVGHHLGDRVDQAFRRRVEECVDPAQQAHVRVSDEGCGRGVEGAARRSALHDRPVEQLGAPRRAQQVRDHAGAGRFAEHGHIARVAPERGDLAAHPPEAGNHIMQSAVRGPAPVGEVGRRGEEAEGSDAVVERHDHGAPARERGAVVHRL